LAEVQRLKTLLADKHPNCLHLLDYSCTKKKSLCSTNYVIKALYKCPHTDASQMSNFLTSGNKNFNGDQLENMYMDALNGLTHLHSKNRVHGNVRPEYIGHDKESDTFMMMENLKDQTLLEKVQI